MIPTWLTENHHIHLPKLFEHLGYGSFAKKDTYQIFKKGGDYYTVFYTEKGFLYYKIQRPQEKLSAYDLVIEHVSKIEGINKEMIWDKVDAYYKEVLHMEELLLEGNINDTHQTVATDFNHFLSSGLPLHKDAEGIYADLDTIQPFDGRVLQNRHGEIVFPLFNIQNEICGYFEDGNNGVMPFRESAIRDSLWYSNIPKKIEGLFLFKDPKEALAFHRKFQLKNVVYLALGEINPQTARILFQIQRTTKVDKIILSFTGSKKLEGYLRDLHFLSYVEGSSFKLALTDRDIELSFPIGNEKSFTRFYDHTRRFNQDLAKSFLKYNKIVDQNKLNRYSILVSTKEEDVLVRLPLEANAIKLLVWSYYKNYLDKTIDILKPKLDNWYAEWEATEELSEKRKEVQLKEYRIAL